MSFEGDPIAIKHSLYKKLVSYFNLVRRHVAFKKFLHSNASLKNSFMFLKFGYVSVLDLICYSRRY